MQKLPDLQTFGRISRVWHKRELEVEKATGLAEQTGELELFLEQEKWKVAERWFKGYTVAELSMAFGRRSQYIVEVIRSVRATLADWHKDEIENLAAERVEAFRRISFECRQLQEKYPRQSAQLEAVIMRAEENIGKIQGVLTDKVQHLVQAFHHVKLYDFEDKFPSQELVDKVAEIQRIEDGVRKDDDLEPLEGRVIVNGRPLEGI